jgi:hypothetical protein
MNIILQPFTKDQAIGTLVLNIFFFMNSILLLLTFQKKEINLRNFSIGERNEKAKFETFFQGEDS